MVPRLHEIERDWHVFFVYIAVVLPIIIVVVIIVALVTFSIIGAVEGAIITGVIIGINHRGFLLGGLALYCGRA